MSDIVGYYISYSSIVASETLKIPVPPKQVGVVLYLVVQISLLLFTLGVCKHTTSYYCN